MVELQRLDERIDEEIEVEYIAPIRKVTFFSSQQYLYLSFD